MVYDALKNPEYFDFFVVGSDVTDEWPLEFKGLVALRDEVDKYKYCMIIDGHVSSWGRPSLVLLSKCVPLVVESKFKPFYKNWVPYVHYVPVKND